MGGWGTHKYLFVKKNYYFFFLLREELGTYTHALNLMDEELARERNSNLREVEFVATVVALVLVLLRVDVS